MKITRKLTVLAQLEFEKGSLRACSSRREQPLNVWQGTILELFAHKETVAQAYVGYRRLRWSRHDQQSLLQGVTVPPSSATLLLVGNCVFLCPPSSAAEAYRLANLQNKCLVYRTIVLPRDYLDTAKVNAKVTDLSPRAPNAVIALTRAFGIPNSELPSLSFRQFLLCSDSLFSMGLLTIPFRSLELGDLRRVVPFCPDFGYSRGTPIDRFYLSQFVEKIRSEIVGKVLEIGGRRLNRELYGFDNAKDYRTMDLTSDTNVDAVADAHNPSAYPPESFDSVVIFNVLEHCEDPRTVVSNIFRWLRSGGKVFAVVPNAQRIHRGPRDLWRIMPDGCASLFRQFSDLHIVTYGNMLTASASFAGIAAEELQTQELMAVNSEYPVITCTVGTKPRSSVRE